MTPEEATAIAQVCLGGHQVELRKPADQPCYWLITAPDGQVRSVMGLTRMTEAQIRKRLRAVVRIHGK